MKRLALTKDGKLTYCTASDENIGKGRCNHVAHQKAGEINDNFLKRISEKDMLYSKFVSDENYKNELVDKLNKMIPEKLINDVKEYAKGESWIIVYGYGEEPYCNNGNWGKTEPYPFITSDNKSFVDMYIEKESIYNIDESNFVTHVNKNKDLATKKGNYVLDKNKRIYKVDYPDVNDYDHIFIKHIPAS